MKLVSKSIYLRLVIRIVTTQQDIFKRKRAASARNRNKRLTNKESKI